MNVLLEPRRDSYAKYLAVFVVSMLSLGWIIVAIGLVVSHNRRLDYVKELDALSAHARVRVNNFEAPEPLALIASLKQISAVWPHHSHPTAPLSVAIQDDSRTVTLTIGRDSERSDEYWIFRGRTVDGWELGRVTDGSLTAQLKRMGF